MNILEIVGLVIGAGGIWWLLDRIASGSWAGAEIVARLRGQDRSRRAARTSESEASQERERKDDEAVDEVLDRPRTGDPAADLRERLYGNGSDGAA